ncbi:unnamed protein product [Anisakis simplex]|uniref:Carboxylic ester hydrolase n=1 Tax=Anisakis simplex TaxID=6269 RepID=A0A0M3KC38_ANISI|nr:unnamed protein product [Anisakis simplex]
MGSVISFLTDHRFIPSNVFETNYGKIRGKKIDISNGSGKFVNVFLGIPYAKPPIGIRRFKEPEPVERWDDIRDCTKHAPRAPQRDMILDRLYGALPKSEDCLYLNVFAPDCDTFNTQGNGWAVLVWIHGGAFAVHSSVCYGDLGICKYLCAKDVVVVTLQYRLGLFGFLATHDDSCVTNIGLRDQTAALKWVKENIHYFGGNPDNITVFGQSAGGACADILSLSPYSRGMDQGSALLQSSDRLDLFHKVIPMSGNASCKWAVRDIAHVQSVVRAHAEPVSALEIGFDGKPGFKTNAQELDIVPVIDGDFIPESIDQLRRKAPRKSWMIGVMEYEALLFAPMKRIRPYEEKFQQMVNEVISEEDYFDALKLRDRVYQIYISDDKSDENMVRSLMRVNSSLNRMLLFIFAH